MAFCFPPAALLKPSSPRRCGFGARGRRRRPQAAAGAGPRGAGVSKEGALVLPTCCRRAAEGGGGRALRGGVEGGTFGENRGGAGAGAPSPSAISALMSATRASMRSLSESRGQQARGPLQGGKGGEAGTGCRARSLCDTTRWPPSPLLCPHLPPSSPPLGPGTMAMYPAVQGDCSTWRGRLPSAVVTP